MVTKDRIRRDQATHAAEDKGKEFENRIAYKGQKGKNTKPELVCTKQE